MGRVIHQACREAVALELGRDCLELGIVPFLTRLVGEANVDYLFERHAGELPDEPPHQYDMEETGEKP